MDLFSSSRGKKDGKRSGLFGKKSASKSNPASPPHPANGRSPPPSYLSNKRAETEYDFPFTDEQRTYRKQPASERVPNPHSRPPVHGYGTPERRRERMSYEPETNAPSSPFHPSGNRTPRKSSEYSRDRMYETDTRSNASPFHPFRSPSPSPSPYHTPGEDHYQAMYEPEANAIFQNSAPGSPFHQAPYTITDNEQFDDLYERYGDVTRGNSSPPSPFHPAARRSPPPQSYPKRRNHPDNEAVYEREGDVTPRNSSPPSPFHPASTRSPPPSQSSINVQPEDGEQYEAMYEADGDVIMPRNSEPRSPVHSFSDDDNHSTYLYPEIATPSRSTPVHHKYQMVVAETYEPPELADESQSFTLQEMSKMRGLKSYEKEESQSMISVSVANYRVRVSVAETLQAIIDKYGDIAASSKLQSNVTRSHYLESLAGVVMELRSKGLRDLTKTRVAEMAAVVKDMESVRINVSWLKKAVEELGEAVEYLEVYEAAKVEREVCERDLKVGKGEMEEMREELEKREKEIRECRERVTVVAGKVGQLEMKGSRLNKNVELFQSKVDKFQGEAVLVNV